MSEDLSRKAPDFTGFDATIDGTVRDADPPSDPLAQTLAETPGLPLTISVSDSLRPLSTWDRYEILSLLGRGGMGAVYKARDRRLGRIVALKFIRGEDESMTQRFVQEARAQSRIDHPFVCKVHEVGEVQGRPYIAMQLVEGQPLDRACKGLGLHEKVQLVRDVATALHTAHEQNIIHRDIKPSNILVERTADGALRPVVMDFGLAREADEGKGLTESGAVLGTPAYMSPEQARGDVRHLDRRTDVYSLGATLYDVLTGVPPFDDEVVIAILLKVIHQAPPPLRSHDAKLPEALELIVGKCLNKEAAQRYPTAQALADDLDRFLSAGRVAARRLGYGYRIGYFARHNRGLFSLGLSLSLSLLCLGGFFVYTRIVNARKAALAQKQAALLRELGQEIKDLEWLMRAAHALPIHDIEREKAQVRQRMVALEQRFSEGGAAAAGLIAYGRGRGHLALHEYAQAHLELSRAESLGTSLPELHHALGRVLGELYERALSDARRSGDASFFEKRRRELAQEFLAPALAHLEAVKRSGARIESPHYLAGLIAFYTRQPEAALLHAGEALSQDGWLYEAKKLEGDVFLSRALDEKDSGQHELAEKSFQEAIKRYESAADIGRSDHEIYEAIAEAWIRQMEIDVERGRDPSSKGEAARRAADRSIATSSQDTKGYTKKAFTYSFQSKYHIMKGEQAPALMITDKQIEAGKLAIQLNEKDAYANEVTGLGYFQKSQSAELHLTKELLGQARFFISRAIQIDSRFSWAYNDLAITYLAEFSADMQNGGGSVETLKQAREYLNKAIRIDHKYVFAYGNLAETNRLLSQWLVEHGQDPREAVAQARQAANTSIEINKNEPNIYGAVGDAYLWQAIYNGMIEKDISDSIERARTAFEKMLSINPANALGMGNLVQLYYIKAKYSRMKGIEERSQRMRDIEKCYKLDSKWAPCLWIEGLFVAEDSWQKGAELARKAVQSALPDQAAEANFVLATILHDQGVKKAPRALLPNDVVDEGLAAAGRAIGRSRSWPRALALQGGLAWLRAQQEKNASRRDELTQLAEDSLQRALAGNPLLQRQYEGTLREVVAASRGKSN